MNIIQRIKNRHNHGKLLPCGICRARIFQGELMSRPIVLSSKYSKACKVHRKYSTRTDGTAPFTMDKQGRPI